VSLKNNEQNHELKMTEELHWFVEKLFQAHALRLSGDPLGSTIADVVWKRFTPRAEGDSLIKPTFLESSYHTAAAKRLPDWFFHVLSLPWLCGGPSTWHQGGV
jgi:hypothetical protein